MDRSFEEAALNGAFWRYLSRFQPNRIVYGKVHSSTKSNAAEALSLLQSSSGGSRFARWRYFGFKRRVRLPFKARIAQPGVFNCALIRIVIDHLFNDPRCLLHRCLRLGVMRLEDTCLGKFCHFSVAFFKFGIGPFTLGICNQSQVLSHALCAL